MGAPARKYELFDDDPVAMSAVPVAPARPRRTRTVPVEPAPGRTSEPPTRRPARRPASAEPAAPARPRPDESRPERAGRPEPAERPERVERPEAPPAPVTAPRAPFVMLVLVLVAAGIIGLLVLNTKINEDSFRLQKMRDRQVALDTREQQLGSELADRQSPGNLAAAARRLGLVPAGTPAFLYLPDGRVVGVAQPGGARDLGGR
jgi:hypothetical protein